MWKWYDTWFILYYMMQCKDFSVLTNRTVTLHVVNYQLICMHTVSYDVTAILQLVTYRLMCILYNMTWQASYDTPWTVLHVLYYDMYRTVRQYNISANILVLSFNEFEQLLSGSTLGEKVSFVYQIVCTYVTKKRMYSLLNSMYFAIVWWSLPMKVHCCSSLETCQCPLNLWTWLMD